MKNTTLIIPAGGIGKRLGSTVPKQFIEICGVPLLIRTIRNFEQCDFIDSCVIAAHPDWHEYIYQKVNAFNVKIPVFCVENGSERQFSVFNALESKYCEKSEFVLIHDAVRPFVTAGLVSSLMIELNCCDAVIPVLRAKDTIKYVDEDGIVIRTLERDRLAMVQTPQAFRKTRILEAFKKAFEAGYFGTDDASVAEFCGMKVKTVCGLESNFKITDRHDMLVAENMLK